MPPWISETIIVGLIAAFAAIAGSWMQKRGAHEQTVLSVMRSQIDQLWAQSIEQSKRISALEKTVEVEKGRSWAALDYARSLLSHVRVLAALVPDPPGAPDPPDPPLGLAGDLTGHDLA